jgi:hypothetical protein
MTEILNSSKKKNKIQKEIKKPNYWTKKEDEILKEKAKEFKYKNWNSIAKFIPGRTSIQCSARFRRIRPGLIKGSWGKEEDSKLLSLYKKYGKNWAAISREMPHRTGKQIRDRFLNSLDEKYDRGKFTKEEDQILLKYYKKYGNSWSKIAKKMKTRTGDMVKNRFYSSLKKEIINKKGLLNLKRKRFTSKFKIKSNNNSKIKINKMSFEFISDTKDEKNAKKDSFSHGDNLNNSEKEDFGIKNQEKIVNIINNTNIISCEPIICRVNLDKCIDENNNALEINEENNLNEFHENLNPNHLFKENENKIKNINKIIENNNNNIKNDDAYFYFIDNLDNNEIISHDNPNDIFYKSKSSWEPNEIDNENNYSFLNQKFDKNDENIEKLNIFNDSELALKENLNYETKKILKEKFYYI